MWCIYPDPRVPHRDNETLYAVAGILVVVKRCSLSLHFFVRFELRARKEKEFREELLRVVEPTRAESDCSLSMYLSRSGRRSCLRFIPGGRMRLRLSCRRNFAADGSVSWNWGSVVDPFGGRS